MDFKFFIVLCLVITFFGCDSGDESESPTRGSLIVFASETVAPMAKQMARKFENIYTDSEIEMNIATAREAIVHLLNDSVEVIIVSRSLNEEEKKVADNAKLPIHEYKIAVGGYVLILNKKNPISGLRVSQIDSVFNGHIQRWSDLGWRINNSKIQFFIPEKNSDEYEFVVNKFSVKEPLPNNFYRVVSIDSVINNVTTYTNAMGIIGLNYYDTSYTGVKFLELSDNSDLTDSLGISGQFFSPAQAFVYRSHYPLFTTVYILSNIKSYGLASGFISFVTSVQGQKIVLNNKLVPATMPVRIIQLNKGEK